MSEPNPYEPPQTPDPLTAGKIVKRGLGVVTILLLTPVAVGIATAGSCAAVFPVLDAVVPQGAYGQAFVLGWLVFLTPPVLTLIGMLWWAVRAHLQKKALAAKTVKGQGEREA
jgi:Na+-transporting NADH:ubiquinone oxidoreductase subunit NqrD